MQDDFNSEAYSVLKKANETIGELRTLLHHAEMDKRTLAAQRDNAIRALRDYLDLGDMAIEAADYLASSDDDAALRLRERIEDWQERREADESEDDRREHAFYGEEDRKPHGSFKQ